MQASSALKDLGNVKFEPGDLDVVLEQDIHNI